jgi:hypothetical protein
MKIRPILSSKRSISEQAHTILDAHNYLCHSTEWRYNEPPIEVSCVTWKIQPLNVNNMIDTRKKTCFTCENRFIGWAGLL